MDNVKLNLLDFNRSQGCLHRLFFITLISTAVSIVVPLQLMTEQSIILKNLVARQNQRDKSSGLISCTTTFIDEYYEDADRISLLLPNDLQDTSDLIEPFMKELRTDIAIYTLTLEQVDMMETYDISANAVILTESAIALERNNFSFTDSYQLDGDFVIALTNSFTNEESFLTEANTLVLQMWQRSIFKLVILAPVNDSILLADSLPVRINESYVPAESALRGRCEQETIAVRWRYFTNKMQSTNSRVVSAAIFDNFPFAYFSKSTGSLKFGGVEGMMVEEIANSMKIGLNRQMIEWTNNSTIDDELRIRLYNATDDLVFGGLLCSLGYSQRKTEYTTSYGIVRITWMIPIKSNVSLRGLIAPFTKNVWYAIICTLIIGGLVKLFLFHDISFLDIAALIFGVSTRQPTKISSRIKFIFWAFFGFFLTQLYLGSLAEQLTSAADLQMETMEELINSGLQIGGTERFEHLLKTPDDTDKDSYIVHMLHENFITFNQYDYINQLQDLMQGKNDTLALLVMLNLTDANKSTQEYAHIIKETVGTYPLALATWKDFPYLDEFNFKIQVLVQAGLVEFWTNMVSWNTSNNADQDESSNSNVELDDLAPAFLLLITGYLGGCCLLIIEVIFYPSKILL
ncbi:uncharacterized protein [Linepithema humile]|uniref:uncharacterized protein n=1 Tax=Linepithema humile TaxID=83485 RepID=UPI00351F72D6